MLSQRDVGGRLPPVSEIRHFFAPNRDFPDIADQYVRDIFKRKPKDIESAAAELTGVFGFGPGSDRNVITRSKSQALLASEELSDSFNEFAVHYLQGKWSLPLASWKPTITLVKRYANEDTWIGDTCLVPDGASVDEFYARFIIRTARQLKYPQKPQDHMLGWLRRGNEEDVCWVLFHALKYLQLETMHFNRAHAPLMDFASHYINKLTNIGSLFER